MSELAASAQKVGPQKAKHPVLAQNAKGQTLIASVIGSGFGKAGTLHWDLLDAQGRVTDSGDGDKLPRITSLPWCLWMGRGTVSAKSSIPAPTR